MPAPRKAGKKSSEPEFQPPPYDPSLPEPQSREQLREHWFPLSLDDRTAQKLLWLSEGGAKVARTTDAVCPYPIRAERYDHSPQVLCREWILGCRAYWEVDFSGWVVLGLVQESAPRKAQDGVCGLGENSTSWGVGWSGSCYQMWHNGENVDVNLPLSGTMGVYVDQPAGLIKFLVVEEPEGGTSEVRTIGSFRAELKEKLLPAFWIGTSSWCVLRKKQD
ncbi:unnamed protein product [Knipowitschia caucasica]|uniref:B30.2/SPRY domain-containing protein n=1 Tax=Knipowitschia caucasica TaxID=637954 RepID=A0AAV2KCQ8_KNICA